jgi:hypothetical protein
VVAHCATNEVASQHALETHGRHKLDERTGKAFRQVSICTVVPVELQARPTTNKLEERAGKAFRLVSICTVVPVEQVT